MALRRFLRDLGNITTEGNRDYNGLLLFRMTWWMSLTLLSDPATARSPTLPTILNLHQWADKLEGQSGVQTRDLRLSKQAALPTASGFPPVLMTAG